MSVEHRDREEIGAMRDVEREQQHEREHGPQ